jgi:beta-lactam-binding protein with PASTA domain
MFGKLMSVSDDLMWRYRTLLTDDPPAAVEAARQEVARGVLHPMEAKKELARRLVADFHGAEAARAARSAFEEQFQRRQAPSDVPEAAIARDALPMELVSIMADHRLASSRSDARRLVAQGAVELDGVRVTSPKHAIGPDAPAATLLNKLVVLGVVLAATAALSGWITMRYLIVGEIVTVPSVVGMSATQAEEALRATGLYLREKATRYDEKVRPRVVLEQDPPPGQRLKLHKRVFVVLSLGSRRLAVPDLVGLTLPQASIRLEEEGLSMGALVSARNNHVVEGTIAAHEPPAGTEYLKGNAVALLVSSGAEEVAFVMPDLIGRHVDDVVKFLQDAGLRLGDVTEEDYEGVDPGTITKQDPPAGSRVASRDIISLHIVRTTLLPEEEAGAGAEAEGEVPL